MYLVKSFRHFDTSYKYLQHTKTRYIITYILLCLKASTVLQKWEEKIEGTRILITIRKVGQFYHHIFKANHSTTGNTTAVRFFNTAIIKLWPHGWELSPPVSLQLFGQTIGTWCKRTRLRGSCFPPRGWVTA